MPKPPLSRRRFLRGAAATSAAPFALTRRAHAVPADDPDVLRVGLVGCGGRGTGAAFQAMQAEEGTVVLTAMADLFPERIENSMQVLQESLGEERQARMQVDEEQRFSGFNAFQQLIDSGVDVVLLATPPHFRPTHLAAAVAAGKHVFCEKPVAVDAPGVRNVMETARVAREQGLSLMSGFCWRRKLGHQETMQRVLRGDIGYLRAFYATYNASPNRAVPREAGWSDVEWQIRNWYRVLWLSGDHIVEQACHSLDKLSWAMGDKPPIQVVGVGGRAARGDDGGNMFDHFSTTFEYENDVRGFLMCRQFDNCPTDNNDYILGERGNASILNWSGHYEITGEKAWTYAGESNDMYQAEHDELMASIRSGQPVNDGDWMTRSTLLGIMARMAAYTGEVVTWEQALASEDRLGPETCELGEHTLRAVAMPGRDRVF